MKEDAFQDGKGIGRGLRKPPSGYCLDERKATAIDMALVGGK